MIHWSWLIVAVVAGVIIGIFLAALLHAADDDVHRTYYRDVHGNIIKDDGRTISQYDPEEGVWKPLN